MVEKKKQILFPPEWNNQKCVQLTWPHPFTDWQYCLEDAYKCFIEIASAIVKHSDLFIVCPDISIPKHQLKELNPSSIKYFEAKTNDSWARDHGGITIFEDNQPKIYDFKFNGWGLKFASNYDNQITKKIYQTGYFQQAKYSNQLNFVFEGGGIESNGNGILLTTTECLLSENRNETMSKHEIELKLIQLFGAEKVLWLNHGFLEGDDTDSHIDTLARFVSEDSIMYVKCKDAKDIHYNELSKMEKELEKFTDQKNQNFNLIPLPMTPAIFDEDNNRLPATYANFLMLNNAILLPIYNVVTDSEAIEIFQKTFPKKEIIPIDCNVLIKQHGSLHCVTMQYPNGV